MRIKLKREEVSRPMGKDERKGGHKDMKKSKKQKRKDKKEKRVKKNNLPA
jgi:hypothetical protein